MQPDLKKAIDAAWSLYVATIPDRSDLSDYHLARDKELFTAGYLEALANTVRTCGEPAAGEP
jgi:hypothetical protein